jgi:outer membrane lipoprotein-sorting protein
VPPGDRGQRRGLIWLDRPGRLRIDYAGPEARLMIANAGRLAVYDRRTHATTTMAVSRTPLGILLAPVIDLSTDVTILGIQHSEGAVQVTLQKTSAPGQGSLTLTLREAPLALSSVTLVDARRRALTMTLSDLRTDPAITPALFAPPAPGS